MLRFLLKCIHACIGFALSFVLLLVGAYAVYCLWDDNRVYVAAEHVQEELLPMKPSAEGKALSFSELLAVNADVCAWIALDNTKIDYPVLQGETNLAYINRDVYGNFALAGSIFLDARNSADFTEPYSVLYGHHMESGGMFGNLDLYADEDFFAENKTGTLVLPSRACSLRVFACMRVGASEKRIFAPSTWASGVSGLLDWVEEKALLFDPDPMEQMRRRMDAGEQAQVLALTTCSDEFPDARTIVLAVMNEYGREEGEDRRQ